MGRLLLVIPIVCRFCTVNLILSTFLLTFNMLIAYLMGQNPESADVAKRVYVIAPICLVIALSVEFLVCCIRKPNVRFNLYRNIFIGHTQHLFVVTQEFSGEARSRLRDVA